MRRVLESIDFEQSLEEKKSVAYKVVLDKKNPTAHQCTQVRKEAFMAFFSRQSYLHSYLLVPCQTDHHFLSAFFQKRRRRRKYIVRQDCNWSIFFLSHLFPTQHHHSYVCDESLSGNGKMSEREMKKLSCQTLFPLKLKCILNGSLTNSNFQNSLHCLM